MRGQARRVSSFLSEDWLAQFRALCDELRSRRSHGDIPLTHFDRMSVNIRVTDSPPSGTTRYFNWNDRKGEFLLSEDTDPVPDLTATLSYDRCRRYFLGDFDALLTGYLDGSVQLDGDLVQLTLRWKTPADDVFERIRSFTS